MANMCVTQISSKGHIAIPQAMREDLLDDYLGISVRQLEYLTAAGETKQTRLPNTRKRLYDILDLDEFIEHSKKT